MNTCALGRFAARNRGRRVRRGAQSRLSCMSRAPRTANRAVTYSNNTNAGTATVTVTGAGNYRGIVSASDTFTIAKQKLTAANVALSFSSKTYRGSVIKPKVTVKNAAGKVVCKKRSTSNTSVKITYAKGCKNVGKYKVTVKGTGNYTGTVTKYFKIKPKGTSVQSVAKGSKSFTVTWKKQTTKMSTSKVTGYQIRYSTSKSMANAKIIKVKGSAAQKKTVSKLKAGKKYYVQVRTYKTVGSTTLYSAWSAKKAVTTK